MSVILSFNVLQGLFFKTERKHWLGPHLPGLSRPFENFQGLGLVAVVGYGDVFLEKVFSSGIYNPL